MLVSMETSLKPEGQCVHQSLLNDLGQPNLAGLGPTKTNLESESHHCVRKNITLPVRAGFHSSTPSATDGLSVMVTGHV